MEGDTASGKVRDHGGDAELGSRRLTGLLHTGKKTEAGKGVHWIT